MMDRRQFTRTAVLGALGFAAGAKVGMATEEELVEFWYKKVAFCAPEGAKIVTIRFKYDPDDMPLWEYMIPLNDEELPDEPVVDFEDIVLKEPNGVIWAQS